MATDTYTIGSGGDYATFNELATAQAANTNDIVCRTLSGALTSANVVWNAPAFASLTIAPFSDAYRHRGVVGSQVSWTAHNITFLNNAGKNLAVDGLYLIANLGWGLVSGSATGTIQRCFQQTGSMLATNSGTGTMTYIQRNSVYCSTLVIGCTNTNASGTSNYTCQNNTIRSSLANCVLLIRTAGTLNATIENNVGFNASTACFNYGSGITVTANNNASSDATADDAAGTGHLTAINPDLCFVAAASDLRLRPGSPLIGAGKAIAEVTADIFGTSRPQGAAYDIGGHEYPPGIAYPASYTRRRRRFFFLGA